MARSFLSFYGSPLVVSGRAQTILDKESPIFGERPAEIILLSSWEGGKLVNALSFRHRSEAGQVLADALKLFADSPNTIVLALPRGGVPVAFEIARCLHLPMDILNVRKLGVPGYEELALGAIASGGVVVLNQHLIDQLKIADARINDIVAREQTELERREKLYRQDKPFPDLRDHNVILVDDGIATGSTMRAAIAAVKQHGAAFVVVATPVAPPSIVHELRRDADEVIALMTPARFIAVGEWYQDFGQTTDAKVRELLEKSEQFGHVTML